MGPKFSSRGTRVFVVLWVSALLMPLACNSDPDLERVKVARKKSSDGEAERDDGKARDEEGADEKSGDEKDGPGDESDESGTDEIEIDAQDVDVTDSIIEYPKFDFKGAGYTTYELKDKLTMRMDIQTEMDEASLSVNTTAAKVECGKKSGCDQKDVDKKVNSNSLGANLYARVSKNEIKDMKKEGKDIPSYAIFAKSARSKQGINFVFSAPVPVYPWPGKASRYESLDAGPQSWTASVTADVHIPNHPDVDLKDAREDGPDLERSRRAIKTFDVTVTFSKVTATDGEVRVKMDVTLPADNKRVLYEYFPMPKTTEYVIDTETQNIMQVHMTSWSNGDRSQDAEESVLTYKICARTTSRGTTEFACQ